MSKCRDAKLLAQVVKESYAAGEIPPEEANWWLAVARKWYRRGQEPRQTVVREAAE